MKGYGFDWFADFVQDLRYVYRTTKKSPGFAAAVILTLALGMGANAAVFSVINAVLFKPLAYPEPDRIVMLMNTLHGQIIPSPGATLPKIAAWRASTFPALFTSSCCVRTSRPVVRQAGILL
jgi:hypothetical protein